MRDQKHYVIGLSYGPHGDIFCHYLRGYKLHDVGRANERVVYHVINGGWTASVYKDGRYACNGSPIANSRYLSVYVRLFEEAAEEAADAGDYNDAIRYAMERYKP